LRCGNGTASKLQIQSSQTGREIEVAPNRFKTLPHSSGDLVVTTRTGARFKFTSVTPFDVDSKYLSISRSIFGPNSVTLSLRIETNMDLYVLPPGKSTAADNAEQPKGYPKVGQKLHAD